MDPELIFRLSSMLAMIGWILLLLFHHTTWIGKWLIGTIITFFAVLYSYLVASNLGSFQSDSFNSLENVANLFQNKYALVAGWVHYLAFDLLAGVYIVTNARKHGIGFWFLLPCLFFTFMFGPFGLLLYLILRWYKSRLYFGEPE